MNQAPKLSAPLRVGKDGRHLVDQAGQPVLIQGDAAWSLIAAATREGVERYLDDLAGKGFNAIIVSLVEAYFAPDPPRNMYGDEPFTVPGDFATPNETYMEHADWVLREAERRGIVVFFVPTYLGIPTPGTYSGGYGYEHDRVEGWFAELLANGTAKCRDFGRYLGRRYASFSNIVWTMGGDRNPGEALAHVRAMAAGIQEFDDRHLFSAHVLPEAYPFDQYPDDPWLSIDFTYSYHIVHQALLRHYVRTPAHPNIMIESTYEYDHNASDLQIRRQAYWSILCGAAGQFIGTLGLFNFIPGWEAMLDSPARQGQSHLHALFERYPWFELVPDLSRKHEYSQARDPSLREFVTAGVGELRGLDFASAARTPDGRLAMVYLPSARPITIDLTQMAGDEAGATWFDPITGLETPGGWWPTDRPTMFIPPAQQDWVLILERRP